jgi:hypothetical protein
MTTLSRSADEQVSMVKSTTSAEMSQGSGSVAVDIGPGANPLPVVMATAAGLLAAAAAQGAAPPVPAVPPPSSLCLLSRDPAVSHFLIIVIRKECDRYARHLSSQSPITLDLSSKSEVMEDHSPGLRDDDDDDDDEADEKMDNQVCDPERLKAFNVSPARAVADPETQLIVSLFFGADVRSFVCRREFGPQDAHFAAAA